MRTTAMLIIVTLGIAHALVSALFALALIFGDAADGDFKGWAFAYLVVGAVFFVGGLVDRSRARARRLLHLDS